MIQNEDTTISFILGMMLGIFLICLFSFITGSYKIHDYEVVMSQEVCKDNGGVLYYQWNRIDYNRVTCGNNAIFKLVTGD